MALTRKQRFTAALAIAELTMTEWAEQRGLTVSHVSQVLRGERESARLTAAIDEFTDRQLKKVAA